jgi:iron complex transport system substrate-binding protein
MKSVLFLALSVLVTGVAAAETSPPRLPRIVSLAPNLTEILCAVGGRSNLVGRTSACDFPVDISRVPIVGGFGAPSLESLVAAQPDHVVAVDLENELLAERIRSFGIPFTRVPCRTLDEIASAMIELGRLSGHPEEAGFRAAEMRGAITQWRTNAPSGRRPSVYIEIWSAPLMTAGRTSFISELVELCGGSNICREVDREYLQVSSEWVIGMNPDIVLCLDNMSNSSPRQSVIDRPGWSGIAAVRNGRVYDGLNVSVLTRPGPRVLTGLESLKSCIQSQANPP